MIPMDIWVMQYLKPEVEVSTKRLERKPVVEAKPPEEPEPEPEPEPAVVTGSLAVSSDVQMSIWRSLAMCESSMDPDAYNPAGPYMGYFQFDQQTWSAYGGPGSPMGQSWGVALEVAQRLHEARGFQPWPGCSSQLGL